MVLDHYNEWKNGLSQIMLHDVFEMRIAPGEYSKHIPGVVCIKIMPWSIFSRLSMVQDHMILEHTEVEAKISKQTTTKTGLHGTLP